MNGNHKAIYLAALNITASDESEFIATFKIQKCSFFNASILQTNKWHMLRLNYPTHSIKSSKLTLFNQSKFKMSSCLFLHTVATCSSLKINWPKCFFF